MKKLRIESSACLLSINRYDGVTIADEALGKMVREKLPKEIKEYQNYPIKLYLSIEFLDDKGLKVETEGYELPEDDAEEDTEGDEDE